MGLRLKFNLVMVSAFAAGLGMAAIFIDELSQRMARRAVTSEASTIMAQFEATIQYSDAEVTPLLNRQMKLQFLPQSVPYYMAQRIFDLTAKLHHSYSLRQPAENPTNPADHPHPWEQEIIDRFKADTRLDALTTERMTPDGEIMLFSRPVRITDPTCLACHSTPAAAPASMVDVYGPRNGFGWKLNTLVGAEIVSVSERVPLNHARASLYEIMAGLTVIFAVMLVLLNLLLHALIVRPVRMISRVADDISLGNLDAPEFSTRAQDEIGALAVAFNRMRRSLIAALRMLEE